MKYKKYIPYNIVISHLKNLKNWIKSDKTQLLNKDSEYCQGEKYILNHIETTICSMLDDCKSSGICKLYNKNKSLPPNEKSSKLNAFAKGAIIGSNIMLDWLKGDKK